MPANLIRAFLDMVKRVMLRYKDEDIIIGWQFGSGFTDMFYNDTALWQLNKVKSPYVLDYSKHAKDAFEKYLESRYTLSELNVRYGMNYSSFDEVCLPEPDWAQSFDLHPQWYDFQLFKTEVIQNFKNDQFALMRKIDPKRKIISWGLRRGPIDMFLQPLKKFNVIFNASIFGSLGNNHLVHIARQNGVSCVNEDYMDQLYIKRYMKDLVIYQSITAGAIGHVAMRAWFNTGVYTADGIFSRWKPIFRRLLGSKPVAPEIGVISSFATQLCREKTFRNSYYPLGNLKYRTGLKVIKTLEYSGYNYNWSSDYTSNSIPQYPLLIDPNSSVLPLAYIKKLKDYVTDGGTLVLFSDSGIYEPEQGNSLIKYPLLHELDFPTEHIQRTDNQQKIVHATNGWEEINGAILHNSLRLSNALLPKIKVVASNDDNEPLVVKWRIGKGEIILFLGIFDWQTPYSRNLITCLQNSRDMRPLMSISNGDKICSSLLKKNGTYFAAFYNNSNKPQCIKIHSSLFDNKSKPIECMELFTKTKLNVLVNPSFEVTLSLPEKSTRIVEFKVDNKQKE